MDFGDFKKYVTENIKDYLPARYENAEISFKEVYKVNDNALLGMYIIRPGDLAVPTIYLNEYYEQAVHGRKLKSILNDMAHLRVEYEDEQSIFEKAESCLTNYEEAKKLLVIHLCETESNANRLERMAHKTFGDFSAVYYVNLNDDDNCEFGAGVTEALLEEWGIDVEQLHEDAMKAGMKREAVFCNMTDRRNDSVKGIFINLLLEKDEAEKADSNSIYYLTGRNRRFGAAFIINEDIRRRIGEILEDDYYVLPSSVHEVVIVPAGFGMKLENLMHVVKDMNDKEVTEEDRLSDKIQYYERKTGIMFNAEEREEWMMNCSEVNEEKTEWGYDSKYYIN